jgi:mannose-binding lectin 2
MVNNGSLHYDHDRDGTHTSLAGCEAKFRNKDYDTFVAIRYQDNALRVRLSCITMNSFNV